MFSIATAAIMHCYSGAQGRHRDVFRSKYLNVLDFIFGSQGECCWSLLGCHVLCTSAHSKPASALTHISAPLAHNQVGKLQG